MLLIPAQAAVAGDEFGLLLIELKSAGWLDALAHLRAADEIIHRGIEEIRDADQNGDLRLDVMVFVFVDGRLGHKDRVRQPLLADAIFGAQGFQILDQWACLLSIGYFNNPEE